MSLFHYKAENHIAYITIQSPPVNALSTGLITELNELLNRVEEDSAIKVIVLKGDGKFFSAGADIKEFTVLRNSDDYEALAKNGQAVFKRLEQFSVPVIAAIHGAALGGGLELAMSCHIRIVSENAKLGLPELTLGIIPGFAGTQRLPRYVGTAKAYEMILTGQPINGKEAEASGLANRAVREEDVLPQAIRIAEAIAEKSKPAIQSIMKLLSYTKSGQFTQGSEEEAKEFGKIFGMEDAKEGIQAFMEKRKPDFKDR